MFSTQFNTLFLALSAMASLTADYTSVSAAAVDSMHGLAHRSTGEVHHRLAKRYSNTRWTFYDVGLGACGIVNVPSDFIVALNGQQFGSGYPGPNCFKQIKLSYGGKTAVATITDMCPGCPYGGLDLSRGLFKHFASEDLGVLSGEWSFVDGSGGSSDPKPTTTTKAAVVKPTTTSTKKADPTTTKQYVAPTTTSSTKKWVAPTTTSTSSTKKAAVPTTTSSKAAAPTTSAARAAVTSSTKPQPQSLAAAISSSASLASSFSSIVLPSVSASSSAVSSSVVSATATASGALPTVSGSSSGNSTEIIQDNIELISNLLVRLGELIATALEKDGNAGSA
ncbi:hypothetical protein D9613_003263 [Agrocybe pediades]|uniref:RlpA-like double-psi beta-barrel-protein domain-containing protein-containing protein n=1 Tax=Agrocybe pediades TaxID=84607 RepID=A0A8H4QR36_9AGAR|nr:hypothetical protein D9613_003263 [Agrocybe pediades]